MHCWTHKRSPSPRGEGWPALCSASGEGGGERDRRVRRSSALSKKGLHVANQRSRRGRAVTIRPCLLEPHRLPVTSYLLHVHRLRSPVDKLRITCRHPSKSPANSTHLQPICGVTFAARIAV